MNAILLKNLDSLLGLYLGVFARKGSIVEVRTVSFSSEPSKNYYEINIGDVWYMVHKSILEFIRI